MFRRGYILVTPAKNEEKNLPLVANSVINQTIKPNLWVIVDDGSTDRTPDIIKNLANKYSWIVTLRLPQHPRDIIFHYAYVCRKGFKYAINYAKSNHIPFEYIALLDADTILEREYFEKLLSKFEKDEKLGIASGSVYIKKGRTWKEEINLVGFPRGTGRIWRKKCFFDTGGYFIVPSPDSVSNRLAIKKGWKALQFRDSRAYQLRDTSSAEGIINGYIQNGKMSRYLGKPISKAIISAIGYSILKKNIFLGTAYLVGFFFANDNYYISRKIQELFQR